MSNEQDAPIEIAQYDPLWPSYFESERDALAKLLATWLVGPIEHVGSTAIPGLCAKPVIDIMAPVQTLDESRPAIDVLHRLDYVNFPYRPKVMHWFCKPSPGFRTHHLHLVPFGSPLWTERLVFRDYLRVHADVATEYGALKQHLAIVHRLDREAYTEAKSPFIRGIVAAAIREAQLAEPQTL